MTNDRLLIDGVIAHLPLFNSVTQAQARAVAASCWTMALPRGTPFVRAGAHPPGICAVAYGSVKLALRNGGHEERVLRLVAARQTFGEASALLGRSSPYDAVSVAETKAVVIPSAPILALLGREAGFGKALVASLAEAHLHLCAEIGAAALQSGAQRLAVYLDELADGGAGSGECAVQLPFSKTLLAARLGMTKETLSRLLRQLSAQGMIVVTQRSILIRDAVRLRAVRHPAKRAA